MPQFSYNAHISNSNKKADKKAILYPLKIYL
jgi:hypothetical protein